MLANSFCTLRRFAKDVARPGLRVLVVAPLSGHFATRLRGTLEALLPEHDVHVTDWTDAREVPLSAGPFGLDDVVAHLMAYLEAMGPGAHALAVSQAAVPAVAAAALMAEDGNPARPRSLTLVAGPVDARVNPTSNELLAERLPLAPRSTPPNVPGPRGSRAPPAHPSTERLAGASPRPSWFTTSTVCPA
jgi:poly(3-hydroxybutyrate) depolymerase